MNEITKLNPDSRYHRICLNTTPENQHANVKQKLAAGDLLFVIDRLREESLMLNEIILDDLRFYGYASHIKAIMAGPGLFLKESAEKIFRYLQALSKDSDELAKFIIAKVPDMIYLLDDEVKAQYGLWKQLVKEQKWEVLRQYKKYLLLEKAGKNHPAARRELIIAGEYSRIFRHPGWEEDLVFVCDNHNRLILTYKELIKNGFYQLAVSQFERINYFFPDTAAKILETLLVAAGEEFLYRQENDAIKDFLLKKGITAPFVRDKQWTLLAQKGKLELIDWEDYAKNFATHPDTPTTAVVGKEFVWFCAYKAEKAEFLLKHRRFKYYFKLKWAKLWKK